MSKRKIAIIIIGILIIVGGTLLFFLREDSNNAMFYDEYGVKVPKGTSIIYLDNDSLINALSTNDKLIFMADNTSKDAKKAVKVLLKTAGDNGIDKIHYYNLKSVSGNVKTFQAITEKIGKDKISNPTLFLLKNKEVSNIEEGYNKDIETRYEDILIDYTMCTTPDC